MPPLYFAGRDEELRKYDDDLRVLCATGESNGLQLTIGAPGSGKTKLADEFAKRVQRQAVEGRTAYTLMISPEELGDPLSLFKTMGRASGGRGISRIAEPTILHSLSRTDAIAAFSETLARLGHGEVPSESLAALAGASHGFPQHINGYLEGAHEALTDVDTWRTRRSRKRCGTGEDAGSPTTTRLEYHDAKDVLVEAGFGAAELDAAIVHGALTCDDEDNVSFGIPSFHAYMKDLLGQERA